MTSISRLFLHTEYDAPCHARILLLILQGSVFSISWFRHWMTELLTRLEFFFSLHSLHHRTSRVNLVTWVSDLNRYFLDQMLRRPSYFAVLFDAGVNLLAQRFVLFSNLFLILWVVRRLETTTISTAERICLGLQTLLFFVLDWIEQRRFSGLSLFLLVFKLWHIDHRGFRSFTALSQLYSKWLSEW